MAHVQVLTTAASEAELAIGPLQVNGCREDARYPTISDEF
jgi:hypothetical protein